MRSVKENCEELPTPQQARILTLIGKAIGLYGRCPSLRELADAAQRSHMTVRTHAEALVGKGYLEKLPRDDCGLYQLTKVGRDYLQGRSHRC